MAPVRALYLGAAVALVLLALPHTYAQVISPSAASAHSASPPPASPASPQRRNRPVILVPGFASTRLMAWKKKNCYSSEVFDVHVGDRVWLDVRQVAFQQSCWVDCMTLDGVNQTDAFGCKLRPCISIDAISELDPGAITGPLSAIFRACISELATHFDYDTHNLQALPYDFRLPPELQESRDKYFSKTKHTFEDIVRANGEAAVVIAHSLGNNVFRYFLAWLEYTMGEEDSTAWIDQHIRSYFAIGAPLLGSAQSLRCQMSGMTMGLPISEAQAKRMWTSWGSHPWMLPFPASHESLPYRTGNDEPMPPLTITWPDESQKTYTSDDVITHRLFNDMARYDADANGTLALLKRYYESDPILNPLKPPKRPPIRNVYCVYGINMPTEVAYRYEVVDGYPWSLADIYFEDVDGQVYRKPTSAYQKLYGRFTGKRIEYLNVTRNMKSGDGTVPYHSLSWCNTWHGDPSKVEVNHEERPLGGYISGWFGVDTGIENIYRFTSTQTIRNHTHKTDVIEFDNVHHREIIRSPKFLSLLVKELVSDDRLNKVKERLVSELEGATGLHTSLNVEAINLENAAVPSEEKKSEVVTELIYVTEAREREAQHQQSDEGMRTGDRASKTPEERAATKKEQEQVQ